MKALILAAGYAKRRCKDIRNVPKPLLQIAGRPLIEPVLAKIKEAREIEDVLIVTNNLYFELFQQWENKIDSLK